MIKNEYFYAIVSNGPYERDGRIQGAGFTFRAALFAGRSTAENDVNVFILRRIYDGMRKYEALGKLPKGATDAYVRMVLATPVLAGVPLVENLNRLDAQDFTWPEDTPQAENKVVLSPDDGTDSRFREGFGVAFACWANGPRGPVEGETEEEARKRVEEEQKRAARMAENDKARTVSMKAWFLREAGIDKQYKVPAVQFADGTWRDGTRTYSHDPANPPPERPRSSRWWEDDYK